MSRGYQTTAIAVTTTGSAGSATGSTTSEPLYGELIDIYFDFSGAPATTDTTVSYATRGGNILVITSSNTDALIAPRQKLVDNANTAITNSFDKFVLNGPITISLAECDAAAPALTAYVRVELP
jgi:threonine dehydrogenase-like Zn-dependent dehydrogenase